MKAGHTDRPSLMGYLVRVLATTSASVRCVACVHPGKVEAEWRG
jgi:hypothetical protein